jgi:hypothetical protein
MQSDAVAQVGGAMQIGLNILIAAETRNHIVGIANSGNLLTVARLAVNEFWELCEMYRSAATGGRVLKIVTHEIFDCTRTNNPIGIASMREIFDEANSYIRDEWPLYCDAFADTHSDPRMRDADDLTYFGDQVHLTDAGDTLVSQMMFQAVRNLRA